MKTELQMRAENIANRYLVNPRKSIVIEFAGVPKAGKTTILNAVYSFLKRCKFNPEIVVERASMCPIRDKKHFNFNVWTACTTLSQILDKTQEPPLEGDPLVLILDRGIFDSICWLSVMERTGRILPKDRKIIEDFLLIDDWGKRINAVILMLVSPKDSLERERGLLPIEETKGSIMNDSMLNIMLDITKKTAKRLENSFRIIEIDTSSSKHSTPEATAEHVTSHILDIIEEQIREEILCVPKELITKAFDGNICINSKSAESLINTYLSQGHFRARHEIEKNSDFIQAIPIVLVRNKKGDILQIRRREKIRDNPLNEKLVIWAGGHVRIEDEHNGNAILQCIIRELKEELRLNVAEEELTLLGAIYTDVGNSTSQHAAIVYELRTKTDKIDVALCSAEFFERRGTSLSGTFVEIEKFRGSIENRGQSEVWTEEIIANFLTSEEEIAQKRMFT